MLTAINRDYVLDDYSYQSTINSFFPRSCDICWKKSVVQFGSNCWHVSWEETDVVLEIDPRLIFSCHVCRFCYKRFCKTLILPLAFCSVFMLGTVMTNKEWLPLSFLCHARFSYLLYLLIGSCFGIARRINKKSIAVLFTGIRGHARIFYRGNSDQFDVRCFCYPIFQVHE